ncbi:hypothetical protein PF001_g29344 [Phytophthora fragariae]|uniref:Uncharacterized protein n=1 Tax=Phytophthora fragariae TaxID=53985 RepID=A0A6A3DT14_9STRA|nr:hypothetical protein PF003_g30336 [Phytophthora fragariae]KAE8922351.1 hypothetical protein PF009_g27387 [Phytophthora fragariae]KAE9269166.1 hypothetical protein PF001_g29344 [Phytophthora fragariae]
MKVTRSCANGRILFAPCPFVVLLVCAPSKPIMRSLASIQSRRVRRGISSCFDAARSPTTSAFAIALRLVRIV